ncbi:hypothetical protein J1779_07850 [Rahnella sp. FC061912-K]|uniref:hypothetical protein n=1 Tax=Rahnella rivi TaxID=2816249 RepID=UPI001C276576|nr:hypothetical protein [Rahnella rivi]MBU9829843.1 hypothetical protein [Rahnella rivi]
MNSDYLLTVYPTTEANWPNENVRTEGLLLRDYFAAKAPPVPEDFSWAPKETDSYQRLVRWSYFYADAMLAARNK